MKESPIPSSTEDDTFSRKKETLEYLKRQQEEQARIAKQVRLHESVKKKRASKDGNVGSSGSDNDEDRDSRNTAEARTEKGTTIDIEKPTKKRRLNSEDPGNSSSGDESLDYKPAVKTYRQSAVQRNDVVKDEGEDRPKARERETSLEPQQKTVIIDLDDDDDDSDNGCATKAARSTSPRKVSVPPIDSIKPDPTGGYSSHSRSSSPYKPKEYSPSAKPPNQAVSATPTPAVKAPPEPPQPDATVRLLIHSRIPETIPLVVCRKLSQRLRECLQAWLQRQPDLTPDQKSEVFLTWRGFRIYSNTSCRGLGMEVNDMGEVCYKGRPLGDADGDEETGAQLQLEAVTQEIVEQDKRIKKRKQEAVAKGDSPTKAKKEGGEEGIKVILRAKGMPDFRLKVKKVRIAWDHVERCFR